jgi:lysophospholipase L1-like esterase
VIGGTLTPFEGALPDGPFSYFHDGAKERLRAEVNAWLRETTELDALIDFDLALRDPAAPNRLLPAFDSGDHLHPNDSGYAAMAACIDLSLFARVQDRPT